MNRIVIILVLAALLGLAIIQVNFIRIGFQLEQRRFDQKMEQTLIDFRTHLELPNELSYSLMELFEEAENFFVIRQDSAMAKAEIELTKYLTTQLRKNDIDISVDYAITGANEKPLYFTTEQLPENEMVYGKYFTNLGRRVERDCDCRLFLHLYAPDFTSYVLSRLAYLILPSVICILAIISCLGLLIYTLRKQRKLHEIKNDFINNLTHELNTPLFSISIANKMLREKIDKKELSQTNKFLNIIDKQSAMLKVHINRVLELASLENEKHHLNKETTEVNQLIEQVIEDNRLKVASLNGRIIYIKSIDEVQLELDKNHFKNALQNLIDNALKYSQMPPEITIESKVNDRKLRIIVRDQGDGIPQEYQKNIFDKFYRVPTGNLHRVKGFGLGLSYVKQIVEAHGGNISLQSAKGKGSSFLISLPQK